MQDNTRELFENCLDGLQQLNGTDFKHTISELKELLESDNHLIRFCNDKMAIIWTVEDVIHRAKEDDIPITEDQAREILGIMERKHDANYGIAWDTISVYLREL